jgi:hypothetical protein
MLPPPPMSSKFTDTEHKESDANDNGNNNDAASPSAESLAANSVLVVRRAGVAPSEPWVPASLSPLPLSYQHSNKGMSNSNSNNHSSNSQLGKATAPIYKTKKGGKTATPAAGADHARIPKHTASHSFDMGTTPIAGNLIDRDEGDVTDRVDVTRAVHGQGWKRAKVPHRVTLLARSRADWITPPMDSNTISGNGVSNGTNNVSSLSLYHLRLPMPMDPRFMVVDRIWCTCISACRPLRTDAIVDSTVRSWVELVVVTSDTSKLTSSNIDEDANSDSHSDLILASTAPVVATAFINTVPSSGSSSSTNIDWQTHTIVFDATHPSTILSALRSGRQLCVRSRCDGIGWSTAIRTVEMAVTYTRWQWADEHATNPTSSSSYNHDTNTPPPLADGEVRREVVVNNYDGGIGDEVSGSDMPHVAITVPPSTSTTYGHLLRLESLTIECVSHDQGWGDSQGVTSSRAELVLYSSAESPVGVSPVTGSIHRRIPIFTNPAARNEWTHHRCTLMASEHAWLQQLHAGHTIALHIRCSDGWGIAVQRSHMRLNVIYSKTSDNGMITNGAISARAPIITTVAPSPSTLLPSTLTSTIIHHSDTNNGDVSHLHPVVAAAVAASASPAVALRRLTSIGPILLVPAGPPTPVHLSPAPTKRHLSTEPDATTNDTIDNELSSSIVITSSSSTTMSTTTISSTISTNHTTAPPSSSSLSSSSSVAMSTSTSSMIAGIRTMTSVDDRYFGGVESQSEKHATLIVPHDFTSLEELSINVSSRVGVTSLPSIAGTAGSLIMSQSPSWIELWLQPPDGASSSAFSSTSTSTAANASCMQRAPLYHNEYPSYDWLDKHIVMSLSPSSSSYSSLMTHIQSGWSITVVSKSSGEGWTTAVQRSSITLKYHSSASLLP